MGDRWSVVPPLPRTSACGRGGSSRRSSSRPWPAVVRAVEVAAYGVTYTLMVAAVTAVVTLAMTLVEAEREGSVC